MLSRLKELHVDPKAIQQIEFVGQLKTPFNQIADNQSVFVLMILEKLEKQEQNFLMKV